MKGLPATIITQNNPNPIKETESQKHAYKQIKINKTKRLNHPEAKVRNYNIKSEKQ